MDLSSEPLNNRFLDTEKHKDFIASEWPWSLNKSPKDSRLQAKISLSEKVQENRMYL
jgi:hypothetical protein